MTRNSRILTAMALPVVAFALTAGPAKAQSYTGNWPITVSQSEHGNGTVCVTLDDAGN
jgi:hypothetical protein